MLLVAGEGPGIRSYTVSHYMVRDAVAIDALSRILVSSVALTWLNGVPFAGAFLELSRRNAPG